eukprot:COSAG02_NODE_1477_length_12419_cov_15.891396_1_plen_35_part_10
MSLWAPFLVENVVWEVATSGRQKFPTDFMTSLMMG